MIDATAPRSYFIPVNFDNYNPTDLDIIERSREFIERELTREEVCNWIKETLTESLFQTRHSYSGGCLDKPEESIEIPKGSTLFDLLLHIHSLVTNQQESIHYWNNCKNLFLRLCAISQSNDVEYQFSIIAQLNETNIYDLACQFVGKNNNKREIAQIFDACYYPSIRQVQIRANDGNHLVPLEVGDTFLHIVCKLTYVIIKSEDKEGRESLERKYKKLLKIIQKTTAAYDTFSEAKRQYLSEIINTSNQSGYTFYTLYENLVPKLRFNIPFFDDKQQLVPQVEYPTYEGYVPPEILFDLAWKLLQYDYSIEEIALFGRHCLQWRAKEEQTRDSFSCMPEDNLFDILLKLSLTMKDQDVLIRLKDNLCNLQQCYRSENLRPHEHDFDSNPITNNLIKPELIFAEPNELLDIIKRKNDRWGLYQRSHVEIINFRSVHPSSKGEVDKEDTLLQVIAKGEAFGSQKKPARMQKVLFLMGAASKVFSQGGKEFLLHKDPKGLYFFEQKISSNPKISSESRLYQIASLDIISKSLYPFVSFTFSATKQNKKLLSG